MTMTTTALNRTNTQTSVTPDLYANSPHSKQVMRQTQALMGVVLLAGTAAAYFVDRAWIVVPVIVGAGLLFAGSSGICPMASLIARMPWNRSAEAEHRATGGTCCGGRVV